jgi:Family of unknown function (DUF5995)
VKTTAAIALALALAALAAAAPASADYSSDIPWPQLLPPSQVRSFGQPHPVRNCHDGKLDCVQGLARRLRQQWLAEDATCDHRAIISYSYLQITKGIRDDLAGPRPGLVTYRRWFEYLVTTFSNRFFAAFRDYDAGRPVPEAWQIALDAVANSDITAGQDTLLFSNAHVQHDLPFAYVEMGLVGPDGKSRKPDHDAVNLVNAHVFDPIEDYAAAHYDPFFNYIDAKPLPFDEIGTLELVKSWREQAWRSAERLANADNETEWNRVVAGIDATSAAWARFIASFQFPGYREMRDAYCMSHHEK